MPLYLNNDSDSFVEFQNNIPENHSCGALLPGGKFLYSAKNSCQLIIEENFTDLFMVRLNVLNFFKKISIQSLSHKSSLHSRISLQENLKHRIKGIGIIYLRKGNLQCLRRGTPIIDCKRNFFSRQ